MMVEAVDKTFGYTSDFARLEESRLGKSPSWLSMVRKDAMTRFEELGFPTMRDEGWRHTSVAPISRIPFRVSRPGTNGLKAGKIGNFLFGDVDCSTLVFVNGFYSPVLSTFGRLPKGARVESLARALETEPRRVQPYLARNAGYEKNAFTALNTAFIADGGFVFLPPRTDLERIIHLLFVSTATGEPTVSHPRNLIVVGSGSRARIVESYVGLNGGNYFTNAVTEIIAGNNAVVDHYKLQREGDEAFHVADLEVNQKSDTVFSSHFLSLGGRLVRNDIRVVLAGRGGDCSLDGLYVTGGRRHVDNYTVIDHARPNCTSRELYKGILDDDSSGVFNGRIIVRQDAQKTSASQTNRNLLLSENAIVDTKPTLEIYADDVKCTHGATIGRLDEQQLFYMRSRGIGQETARSLLTYAFAADIVNTIKIKPIQCQIDLVLLTLLSRGGQVKELV